jgi:hypothetical protein
MTAHRPEGTQNEKQEMRNMETVLEVTKEEVTALEKSIEYDTGLRLPIGEKMVERGFWKIKDD